VDTRKKILTLAEAKRLAGPVVIAAGAFDILRAGHARELAALRDGAPDARLLVAVLPSALDLAPARARAEMAAGLRMVDYVVTADAEDLEQLSRAHAACVVRLDAAERRRIEQLIEHVRRRQSP
jgi:glycerol-3-phosphate cytidylyltransferase-like family protein